MVDIYETKHFRAYVYHKFCIILTKNNIQKSGNLILDNPV